MADPKHLAELRKGYRSWNQWRRDNPHIIPNLARANLSQVDLSFADLKGANLNGVKLHGSDLRSARFIKADLRNASLSKTSFKFSDFTEANLSKANFREADLSETCFRKASLSQADLSKANLNKAILSFTDLYQANLSKADLALAVLKAANLHYADLSAVQALETDFTEAILTGACLLDWHINSKTILEDVQCDYIYLNKGFSSEFSSRFPNSRTFQPGEFTQTFQKDSQTTDLFFTNGITEFLDSYQELKEQHPDQVLSIQEMETKSDSTLIVRVETLPEDNQEATKKFYEEQLQLAKVTYELQASAQMMEVYKQHNAELVELVKLSATKSINVSVEATAMSNSEEFNNNFQGANIGNFANKVGDNARQQANQYNYNSETKSLADAAKEIQALLDQLSQSYPTDTEAAKRAFANEAIQHINNDHSLTQRVLSALSAGSTSALEKLLNHPAASFVVSALKDWQSTRVQ